MVTDVFRKGSFLEKLIARLFNRIGFETKLNSKEYGFESDVIAKKRKFSIIIEAKQYDKAYINLGALIDQWANRAKRTGVDRVLLVITGHKNIPEKYYQLAKQEGIYLWGEDTVHNLNDIETKEQLYFEIGKKLEFTEVVEKLEKRAKKILTIKLVSIAVIALLLFGFLFYSFNQEPINNDKINSDGDTFVEPLSPEDLKNFCSVKFYKMEGTTKIINTINYFEDYSSASLWLEKKYPYIEGVTHNFPKNFKENYLSKVKFPIYLIDGTIEGEGYFSNKLYACDETGIFL